MNDRKQALESLRDKVAAGTAEGFNGNSDFSKGLPLSNQAALAYDAFHGSLDAAKALHDAVVPERPCGITFVGSYGATVTFPPTWETMSVTWSNENPARAWLLAILEALISETPKEKK